MAENKQGDQTTLIPMTLQQLLRVLATGAMVGLVTWMLTSLLDIYVFKNIVCRGTESMQCAASLQYANISASILGGGIGLFLLARFQIFRALLVVIAATASLWGIVGMLDLAGWQIALPASILLFMMAYGLFAWIARLRSFVLALVTIIVLAAVVRFVLNL